EGRGLVARIGAVELAPVDKGAAIVDLDSVGRGRLRAVRIGLADEAILQARRGRGPAATLAVPHQIGGLADLPIFLSRGSDRLAQAGVADIGRRGAGGER